MTKFEVLLMNNPGFRFTFEVDSSLIVKWRIDSVIKQVSIGGEVKPTKDEDLLYNTIYVNLIKIKNGHRNKG